MSKIQRGSKVAVMLLSLLALGVVADSGSLFGQSQTTNNVGPVVTQHGAGCSSCNAPAEVVYTQPTPVYTASATSCGCTTGCKSGCRSGCTSCLKKKASCPKCDCQFCELEVKKGEVEKTSYKVEQKEVCIPAVRLPWKKCCPPKRSKVRTVNVLKKHKYKCPECQYKWNVHEPEDFKKPEPAEKKEAVKKEAVAKENAAVSNEFGMTPDELKEFNLKPGEKIISVFSDPSEALGDVPRPPVEKK